MRRLVLGTAGHIDHGKTSLVKALTGVDTDRLKEEKERGITIELGFTQLALPDGTHVGFVDVPGHERFVRTMIAGASGIDLVLLVIAADEGVMPQTREHLDVCSLLGVKDGLVVLNKIDAVEPAMADLAAEEAAQTVAGTFLEGRPIVRASAKTGAGIPELAAAIAAAADRVQERSARGPFRMSVDRVFSLKGFGTVVTGTASSGRVQTGDVLAAFPGGATGRVRGIQVHGKDEPFALAGQRTAINLPNLERDQVPRGSVLAAAGALLPSYLVDIEYRSLKGSPALSKLKRVRFLSGTQEVVGNLVLFDKPAETGAASFAQLRLEAPVAVRAGDHFVLRSYSPMVTIGGGRVLDSHPRKRKAADPGAAGHLAALAGDDPAVRAAALVADGGPLGLTLDELTRRLPPAESEDTATIVRALSRAGTLETLDGAPPRALTRAAFDAIATAVLQTLADFHAQNPSREGMARGELAPAAAVRAGAGGPAAAPAGDAVLRKLEAAKKIVSAGGEMKLPGHVARLDATSSDLRPTIVDAFREAGLQPPTVKELTDKHAARAKEVPAVLSLLVREGVLVKVSQDLFFHKEPLEDIQQKLVAHLKANAKIAPLQFKELAGNISRKFMIPLLEHFDTIRLTMRVGEERVLRKKD